MILDRRLLNVGTLGLAFMLVFTAFQTMGNIEKVASVIWQLERKAAYLVAAAGPVTSAWRDAQNGSKLVPLNSTPVILPPCLVQTVLDSIRKDDPSFTGNGYISLAIIYTVFAVCNWLAPSMISVLGARLTMFIGGLIYAMFIVSFLFPHTWLLYSASALIGVGAAAIWTGQGTYLTLNSDANTISRNSGIFWAMLQSSMFFGNIFVSYAFQGKTHIDKSTRVLVFSVLTGVCGLGVVVLLLLPRPRTHDGECVPQAEAAPLKALRGAFSLFFTKEMLFLCVTFLYTGFELSFYSGVYSTCIGFTNELGESAKTLVGLSGIFIGFGEVLGGVCFGLLGSKTIRWGRSPIVILGFVIHIVAFFIIYLNLPNSSPFGDTSEEAHIKSSAVLAILCSLLLGLGDSCFNTQILSILGGMYPDDSAPAFAIFKFTQSLSAAGSFFYANQVGLYMQLYMLAAWGTVGTITFCLVENVNRHLQAYTPSSVVVVDSKEGFKQN